MSWALVIFYRLSLVESIPENLTYPPTAPRHTSTYDSWVWLLKHAVHDVSIASYYWTLTGAGDITDSTDKEVGTHRWIPCMPVIVRVPVSTRR